MLARFNVRQKLTLLLVLPLIAVLLTAVPFAVGQINSAVAAGSTVGVAEQARTVGVLVQDLQEERLLALAFLATREADQAALISRTASTDDHASEVEQSLELPRDVKLKSAIGSLRALVNMRRSILRRTVSSTAVFDTYHTTVVNLIDALRLTQQEGADATGIRQMNTLDALLRTNEETGRVGAALVLASTDTASAIQMVEEAQLLRKSNATRFRQQADAQENTLLNLVEQGPTGRRADALVRRLYGGGASLSLTDSLSAAQTIITLTRVQQERIARDIADRASTRASNARSTAGLIISVVLLLAGLVILLSAAVSRSVSRPLRSLTAAAVNVAEVATAELVRVADSEIEDAEPPHIEAVEVSTSDEIGDLAVAFNRVQMTAARLMEQQIATRRNTSTMFANIARRTRSMVSRQLTFIDDLERNEQNERLLAKLYRLDHLTTRLHRSADSLLVVSGAREDERIATPAPLPEVIRSAVSEIEGYQNVHVGALVPVIVAPALVPDLRLVLAELLENATAFSPPGAPVEVIATVDGACRIFIIDHGIGMPEERLADENRRLVERERLDVVPTSVLGLFVVGRLARRHGLNVELSHTGEQGITATVTVPIGLFTGGGSQRPGGSQARDDGPDELAGPPMAPQPPAVQQPPLAQQPPMVQPPVVQQPPVAPPPVAPPAVPPAVVEPVAQAASAPPVAPPVQPGVPDPANLGWFVPPPPEIPAGTPIPGSVPVDAAPPAPPTPPTPPQAPPPPPAGGTGPDWHQSTPRHAGIEADKATAGTGTRGLKRRTPGGHLPSFGIGADEFRSAPITRDAVAERAELEAFAMGTAQAAAARLRRSGTDFPELPPTAPSVAQTSPAQLTSQPESVPTAAGQPDPAAAPVGQPEPAQPEPRPTVAQPEAVPTATATVQTSSPRHERAPGEPAPRERAAADATASGTPAGAQGGDAQQRSRAGLTRRKPGSHLSEYLRAAAEPRPVSTTPSSRDADAERAALDSFLDGLARASTVPDQATHL